MGPGATRRPRLRSGRRGHEGRPVLRALRRQGRPRLRSDAARPSLGGQRGGRRGWRHGHSRHPRARSPRRRRGGGRAHAAAHSARPSRVAHVPPRRQRPLGARLRARGGRERDREVPAAVRRASRPRGPALRRGRGRNPGGWRPGRPALCRLPAAVAHRDRHPALRRLGFERARQARRRGSLRRGCRRGPGGGPARVRARDRPCRGHRSLAQRPSAFGGVVGRAL